MGKKSKKSGEDEPPYMVFQLCKDKCLACNYCGYHWGPGHSLSGQKPYWIADTEKDGNE